MLLLETNFAVCVLWIIHNNFDFRQTIALSMPVISSLCMLCTIFGVLIFLSPGTGKFSPLWKLQVSYYFLVSFPLKKITYYVPAMTRFRSFTSNLEKLYKHYRRYVLVNKAIFAVHEVNVQLLYLYISLRNS